jgi:SAM-dependent methyltransferase
LVDLGYTAADHDFRESDDYAGAKYALTLRWLGPARGRKLLNIGCGSGHFNALAHAAGFSVESCEPDPDAYAHALEAAPAGVVVHNKGLFDVPFTGTADVVVMHDVLEHIEDEAGAVSALHGFVAPAGTLIVSVPALQALFGLHDEQLGHFRRYSRKTLKQALGAQFEVRKLRYFGFSLLPVTFWFSRWRRQPYPTSAVAGPSMVGRLFRALCSLESRVAAPLGTSLVCEAAPKTRSGER